MVNEFTKGDYIVLLKGESDINTISLNICYKQRENNKCIKMEFDNSGSTYNGWSMHPFNKSKNNDWRYATELEILEYNRINQPFDVSKINQELIIEIW